MFRIRWLFVAVTFVGVMRPGGGVFVRAQPLTSERPAPAHVATIPDLESPVEGVVSDEEAPRSAVAALATAKSIEDSAERGRAIADAVLKLLPIDQEAALEVLIATDGAVLKDARLRSHVAVWREKAESRMAGVADAILSAPDSDRSCHSLANVLNYAALFPEVIAPLARRLSAEAPRSKASALMTLSEIDRHIRDNRLDEARELLTGPPTDRLPPHLRALFLEREGDHFAAAQDPAAAVSSYTDASRYYCYEHTRGGFTFFRLKASRPDETWTPFELRSCATALKAYLMLARGERIFPIAELQSLAEGPAPLGGGSLTQRQLTADVRFLMSLAYADLHANALAIKDGRAAIKAVRPLHLRDHRRALLDFARMLSSMDDGTAPPATDQVNPIDSSFYQARRAYERREYALARSHLEGVLATTPTPGANAVFNACNGGIRCLISEDHYAVTPAVLGGWTRWAKSALPTEYADYAPLAVARGLLLLQDVDAAEAYMRDRLESAPGGHLSAQVLALRGKIALSRGDLEAAYSALIEALSFVPPDDPLGAEVLLGLGHVRAIQGDYSGAGRIFATIRQRYPKSEETTDSKAFLERTVPWGAVAQGDAPLNYNLLLVSMDTVRADHLSCYRYGRNTSPALDDLARHGVLFEEATAASSWTVPSHMSMFTSLYPSVHGVDKPSFQLGQSVPTLAEILGAHGYSTAGFVTGPSMNHRIGFDKGFDVYDDFTVRMLIDPEQGRLIELDNYPINQVPTNAIITHLAEAWLRSHRTERFFLFVHLWDSHHDYAPQPPFRDKFDPDYRGGMHGRDLLARGPEIESGTSVRDLEHLVALYDGDIAYTDAQLRKLLDTLDSLELTERTLVVVVSDHGEAFLEHGRLRHGNNLHEEEIRVPWVMRLPGVLPEGRRVRGNVSHVDMMPTLLGILGLPAPTPTHGLNLHDACLGPVEVPDRPVYSELNLSTCMRAVRWGEFKVIDEGDETPGPLLKIGPGVAESPAEAANTDEMTSLRERLVWALRGGFGATVKDTRTLRRDEDTADRRTVDLFRSLGYLE
jgi:tetratricopeptide (TPR) repeat protein